MMRILASVLLLVTARMAAETEAFRDERPVFLHAPAPNRLDRRAGF